MVEADSGAERLTPDKELIKIIDGHFVEVGGVGEPLRLGEEQIRLLAPNGVGAFGIINPTSIRAVRPVPSQEGAARGAWPDINGHRIYTLGQDSDFSESMTFFVRGAEIWVSGSFTHRRTQHSEGGENSLDPHSARRFLDWLKRATPFF